MISINIDSLYKKYQYDKEAIISGVIKTLSENKVTDGSIDIFFANKKMMMEINKKYYKNDKKLHPIFTFLDSEAKGFIESQSLGQIIICYPVCEQWAKSNNTSIDQEIIKLAVHGTCHLLNIHH